MESLPFDKIVYGFYCAGIVMVGGGFVLYTGGGDLRVARDAAASSLVSQLVLGLFYITSSLLLVSHQDFRRVLKSVWPILLLPALAILSYSWSADPDLTARRAIAFAGTIFFGLSLGWAYQLRDGLVLVGRTLAIVMLACVSLTIIDPAMAIHQSYEAIQAVHAGSWRGIFAHRNTLGLWSATTFIMLFTIGRREFGGTIPWITGLGLATTCLVMSGSSAGIALVALCLGVYVQVSVTRRQPKSLRGGVLLLWLLLLLLVVLLWGEITRLSLDLLGRTSDLSGRTYLWTYLLDLVQPAEWPLGLGYFSGTVALDQRISSATQIRNVNAHNGFLEAFVYFGWLGLIVALSLISWVFYYTGRLAFGTWIQNDHFAVLPLVLTLLVGAHNIVESTLVSANNLDNVVLSAVVAMTARAMQSPLQA